MHCLRRNFCALLVLCLIVLSGQQSWADSHLMQVYRQVLKDYSQDHDATKAFSALQIAGIKQAIDKQPASILTADYVRLLNDFAFFRYQSTAFKENVPMTVHFKKLTYVGNERMQRFDDIPNATMRLNRLCEAIQILEKVIALDPERSVAYLNLADVYWRSAQYAQKIGALGGRQGWAAKKVTKLVTCIGDKDVGYENFFRAYDTYQLYRNKMIEQGKADQIPDRVSHLLSRRFFCTVVQDANIQLGDYLVCEDYEDAMNLLSDKELRGLGGTRGNISQYSHRFKFLAFDSFSAEFQQKVRKSLFVQEGRRDPYMVYEHNGYLYIDEKNMFLNFIHTEPDGQYLHGGASYRCLYRILDFKRKFAM